MTFGIRLRLALVILAAMLPGAVNDVTVAERSRSQAIAGAEALFEQTWSTSEEIANRVFESTRS